MPKPMLGGYTFRDIMAWVAVGEGDDIDALSEAIEELFTDDPKAAAKRIREVAKNMRLRMKLHTLLQANDVEEAKELLLKEILPAIESGEGKKS